MMTPSSSGFKRSVEPIAAGQNGPNRHSTVTEIYAIRLEPPAEAGELIGRQLGNHLGDFFDLHVAQYNRSGLGFADGLCKDCPVKNLRSCREACPSCASKGIHSAGKSS